MVVAAWCATALAAQGAAGGLSIAWAAVLGAVQGATEFLPVSSSGHLSLGQALLGIDAAAVGHRFNITVHAGTLCAVVWVYRLEVVALARAALRPHVAGPERTRLMMIALATLPLGVVLLPGVEASVIAVESSPRLVGAALCTTAAILFLAFRGDRGGDLEPSTAPPTARQAILIGLAQLFAVIPGISRSGSTIAAGLGLGLDRAAAARFSFLISLPAIGGATAKLLVDLGRHAEGEPVDLAPFAVGFACSLVVGLLSLRGLLYLVNKGRVAGFVVYLLLVGSAAMIFG